MIYLINIIIPLYSLILVIDINLSSLIQSKGLIHGDRVRAFITETAYSIDEPGDVDFLEYMIQKNPEYVARLLNEKKENICK